MRGGGVWTVARWEVRRFAKPRDLLLSAVFFAVMFGIYGAVTTFLERRNQGERPIAVLNASAMSLQGLEKLGRFRLLPQDGDVTRLEAALQAEEFDALLVVQSPSAAELRVRSESGWQQEFLSALATHRQAQRPAELDLPPHVVEALTRPLQLQCLRLQDDATTGDRAGTWTVLIIVGTMLMGLFTGFSYVFVAITSEKSQKVTESVLAAITPQQWMDGKILGLTLVVAANLVAYALGYLVYKVISVLFLDASFDLPSGLGDPQAAAWLVMYAVLGFGFWFTVFAVVAATISDPNTSSRSGLLFLPFLPLALAFAGLDEPDALWMRVLSWTPGLSPTAMPVRLLRGDPALVEVIASLLLLAAMVVLLRRAAGRAFGVSMLMTGKEPGWREVWRWMRQA